MSFTFEMFFAWRNVIDKLLKLLLFMFSWTVNSYLFILPTSLPQPMIDKVSFMDGKQGTLGFKYPRQAFYYGTRLHPGNSIFSSLVKRELEFAKTGS